MGSGWGWAQVTMHFMMLLISQEITQSARLGAKPEPINLHKTQNMQIDDQERTVSGDLSGTNHVYTSFARARAGRGLGVAVTLKNIAKFPAQLGLALPLLQPLPVVLVLIGR